MCEDIQKTGKPANRLQGGIHHRLAGRYAGYLKPQNEFPSVANVIDTKTKNATAKFRGWTIKELKDKCGDLEDENEDFHNQVYHNVCIVSACLCTSGVLC